MWSPQLTTIAAGQDLPCQGPAQPEGHMLSLQDTHRPPQPPQTQDSVWPEEPAAGKGREVVPTPPRPSRPLSLLSVLTATVL